jgi:hypothetical protein
MQWLGWMALGLFVIVFSGCDKKESPPPSTDPIPLAVPQLDLPSQIPPIPGSAKTIVPDSIKNKWKSVKLRVEDKKDRSTKDYTVNIGSELSLPNSGLVVKVYDFLPDLKIEGSTFTSASAELLNPSVHVQVLEEGKEVFNGWLFQLFPTVHPFQHDRFGIVLREAISVS